MIRHILLFKFKAHASKADIETAQQDFLTIPSKIEGVVEVEWGANNSPEDLNKDYEYSVVMTFANEAARQRYLPHPDHDLLKQHFVPLLEDIIVFDYSV
ncbi:MULTISPECIES: Dabb family protein [unclassified Agarivorans]|uniref:Dabb family protein n=1 Tax=unclassified Agarivorans TaxID=2636026 RepID=UPI0026E36634|nr:MULTISPECIES: Dabb family protein [unclassified Agarivorans]MDO6683998.1 Dabb family protein [Agarivorans sp. 3_MG-2023]MDO6714269.1 Dabb family protein [Agarivorans sp. 2_MG-2023]